MLTAEQLAARKVGGSMVPTILGLNPYKSALELYLECRGELPPDDLDDNMAVAAGNIMEDAIAELAAWKLTRLWGREIKLRRSNITTTHPKYNWLTCHIDRDFVGLERGLEIKNVGFRLGHLWGAQDTDAIPDYYLPQVHTYLLVKNYPVWSVVPYFGGADLRHYEVERDREMDELIVESTHDFWFNHVLKGIPPDPPASSPRALEVAKRVYPGTDGTTIEADEELEHWRGTLESATRLASTYEKSADLARAHLLFSMKNAAVLRFADGTTFERKLTKRKAYTVEATEYVDARLKKAKE